MIGPAQNIVRSGASQCHSTVGSKHWNSVQLDKRSMGGEQGKRHPAAMNFTPTSSRVVTGIGSGTLGSPSE